MCFWLGCERDLCKENPCYGVRRNKEKARTKYITDEEYSFVYNLAKEIAPAYVSIAMEIAFLCRARRKEILQLNESSILEEGLLIERAKKSKLQIIVWTERLRRAIKAAQDMPGVSWQRYMIHSKNGQ